ncbi:HAMP domain-containing sensor histidine kinase [Streptomyces sp. NPDC050703]|uniref:sensor histidine kinase n=1 Tax=Streptomyces sp. NPDC050703 TaxID=3157218 RepID=UPI00343FD603
MLLPPFAAPARGARPRPARRRASVRLTLLYGALFAASGALLLALTCLLVAGTPGSGVLVGSGTFPDVHAPGGTGEPAGLLHEQAARRRGAHLRHLLVRSGIALAVLAVVSAALGRLVAARALRPVRTLTRAIRRASADGSGERPAVARPAAELNGLADSVEGLLGRLDTVLDAQRRFVADAAHGLRPPLARGHALITTSLVDGDATAESLRRTFERLLAISEQQARLLESLLALAGSRRGLDHREPLDLAFTAAWVLDAARPEIEARGLRVVPAIGPAPATGDPELVRGMLAHLVDNAVRHNVPGGLLEVTTRHRGGRAVVSVANTGPLVPPGQVEGLSEPVRRPGRADGDGEGGGPGLGLSIVHAVALAHGAAIDARARAGGGLAVEVAFPPDPGAAAERGDDVAQLDE